MATHLSLQRKTKTANGGHPIVISVGFGTNLQIATGLSCLESEWDARAQLFTGKGAAAVNRSLSAMLANASSVVLELAGSGRLASMNRAQLRAAITGKAPRKVENSIAEIFRLVMKTKRESTRAIFKTALAKLSLFCDTEATPIGDITRLWIEEWAASEGMQKLKTSTRAQLLHKLQHVVNYALDEDIIVKDPFRRFKMPKVLYRRRALPVESVRAIINAPMSPRLEQYRDLWVLSFCLIGTNLADLYKVRTAGARIEFLRAKTGRPYSIKIEPEAEALIEKHKGKERLLHFFDDRIFASLHTLVGYNLPLVRKAVNAAAGEELISELTLYWARHSWATIAASLDIPKDVIAMALGHGRLSVTDGYIDYEQAGFAAKVDAANRKVLDFVFYGKNQ